MDSLYFQFEAMEVRSRSLLIIKKLLWFFSSLLSLLLIHFHFVKLYLSESVKTCVVFYAALFYIYLLYIYIYDILSRDTQFVQFYFYCIILMKINIKKILLYTCTGP